MVDVHLNWLNWFCFLILEGGQLIILIDCMIFPLLFLDVTRSSTFFLYFYSFFPCTVRLWNSLPLECFPLTYNINGINLELTSTFYLWVLSTDISCMPQLFYTSFSCYLQKKRVNIGYGTFFIKK